MRSRIDGLLHGVTSDNIHRESYCSLMATTIALASGWIDFCVATDMAGECHRCERRRLNAKSVRHEIFIFSCSMVAKFMVAHSGRLNGIRIPTLGKYGGPESFVMEIRFIDTFTDHLRRDYLHLENKQFRRPGHQEKYVSFLKWDKDLSSRIRFYILGNPHWRIVSLQKTRPPQPGFNILVLRCFWA